MKSKSIYPPLQKREVILLQALSYKAPDIYYRLARLYSLKNDKPQAIEALEKAVGLTHFDEKYIPKTKDDEDFDNIRSTPKFQRVINERKS